jgi:tetratricopeptide (TPR) repeat protein
VFLERTIRRVHELTGDEGVAWRLAQARFLLVFTTSDPENAQATKLLNDVLQISPQSVQAHVLLAQSLQRAKGTIDALQHDAIEQMKIATGLSPTSVPLGLSLVQMLAATGEFDAAREELARVRSVPWSDPDQRRKAAVLAAQVGDPRLALSLVQEAAAQSTSGNGQDLLLAQMYWLSGNSVEAKRLCDKLLQQPDLPVIQFASDLYASTGNLKEARQILIALDSIKLEPGMRELVLADFANRYEGADASLRYLEKATGLVVQNSGAWRALVAFHFAAGQIPEAIAAIHQGIQRMPNDLGLNALRVRIDLLASIARKSDLRAFAIAFARNPQDPAAADVLNALSAQLAGNFPSEAICDGIKTLAPRHPQFLALQMYLVQTYINAGLRDEAINVASSVARQFPGSAEPQALYVSLLRDQERWNEVLAEAQRWRDRTLARPVAADLQIAEAYTRLRRPAEAMKQLDTYITNAKDASEAYSAVLPAYAAARQAVGQTGTAELMEPLLQQGARGRMAWMTFAVESLEPSQAVGWLERVEPLIPADATGERVLLSQMWGTLFTRQHDPGESAKARAILQPLASNPKADAPTVLAMGLRDEQDGNLAEATNDYRRAHKLDPSDIVAENNLAMMLARSGSNLDEAVALVQDAMHSRPDVPALYDTLAFIEGKKGRFDDAVSHAKTAVRMQPQHAQFHVTLAQLLLDSGKRPDAAEALRVLDKTSDAEKSSQSTETRQQIKAIRNALKNGADQVSVR